MPDDSCYHCCPLISGSVTIFFSFSFMAMLSSQFAPLQVHEEVLRLLLAVAKQLSPERLGRYLQTTIQRSRKSRRCATAAEPLFICSAASQNESLLNGMGLMLT